MICWLPGRSRVALERVERKLAAILAAHVAGYSRLAGADEERTLTRLRARCGAIWSTRRSRLTTVAS